MLNAPFSAQDITCFINDNETKSVISLVMERLTLSSSRIVVGDVNDAIEYFRNAPYTKIIIVDCCDEELITSKVETLFSVCGPDVHVIVIGNKNEVGIFRDLIKINVSDYLVKPLNIDIVTRTLTSIIKGEDRKKRSGKIITFMGALGGSGCTTIALNTACILANEMAKKVIIVDMDMQFGSIPLKLDLKISHSLRESLEAPDRIDDAFLEQALLPYGEFLKVLCSEEPLYEYFSADNPHFLDNFESLVTVLSSKFHYIFFDISRFQTPLWRLLNKRSDHFFITSDLSLLGLRDSIRLMNMLNEENNEYNHQVVINSISEKDALPRERFEKSLGQPIVVSLPYEASCVTAANLGIPVVTHTPKFRRAIQPLVDKITGGSKISEKQTMWDRIINLLKK